MYRIFYGKYPDQTTNEIPAEHIKSLDGMKFAMEAGKPGEPQVDGISFTLANLDHTSTERYDDAWFETNSRSQAEGGLFPNQLFFSVEIDETGAEFKGVFDTKSYSAYRAEVTVEAKSLLSLLKDSNLTMLNAISVEKCSLTLKRPCDEDPDFDVNDYPCGKDLEGNNIKQEMLRFFVEDRYTDYAEDTFFTHRLLVKHFFGIEDVPAINPGDSPIEYNTGLIKSYVKINEITLLTAIRLVARKTRTFVSPPGEYRYNYLIYFEVYHAMNDNVTTPEGNVILQRGRYFSDDEGNDLGLGNHTVTFLDPDRGYTENVMIKEADLPASQYLFGCPITVGTNDFQIQNSGAADVFDLVQTSMEAIRDNLYAKYYQSSSVANLELSKMTSQATKAFWADLMMFGWADQKVAEIMVNMAMLTNSYLFVNEQGNIALQNRLYHEDYLPAALPPGAFEVQLGDIKPLGSQENNQGFDSFSISFHDRIAINNVETDDEKTVSIDSQGQRDEPALRNTELTVQAYRTASLGVPADDNGLPVFRYSPDDANFAPAYDLQSFIPTPQQQAQAFAQSWDYPVTVWNIQWDMNKYPAAGIGAYFWIAWPNENRVYLIRQITHDAEAMLHKMEVQQIGVYTP